MASRVWVGLSLAWWALSGCAGPKQEAPIRHQEPHKPAVTPAFSTHVPSLERSPVEVPKELDWLLFGGGSEPLSNQISLAQDLALARELLSGHGLVLFASGKNAPVSVEDHPPEADKPSLQRELSRMFGVPGADVTRYEPAKLDTDGPSTADQVLHVLERGLASGTEPLFVYAACHGDRGPEPNENSLALWGGWSLKVRDVTAVLDRHDNAARGTRFVITACFGGGFAELAFVGGDPKNGPRSPEHCGLFAAPWDEEASGCDPNPDRRVQESYSIHFMHALAGKDRRDIPRMRDIDINGDQQVSLLEAHTYARIASRSFDTPTTTSERFLRQVAKSVEVPIDPLAAPEEVPIVRALGEELELPSEAAAREKLAELNDIQNDADEQVSKAQKQADDSYFALRIALLERFPLLEHPWEPRGQQLLLEHGPEITKLLLDSELAHEQAGAARELDQAVLDQDSVRVARARVQRLVQAFETLRLASALKRKSGPEYAHFTALRRCENWVPRLRSHAR